MECHLCEQPAVHQCGICGVWLCDEHAELYTIRSRRMHVCSDDDECMTRGLNAALAKEQAE